MHNFKLFRHSGTQGVIRIGEIGVYDILLSILIMCCNFIIAYRLVASVLYTSPDIAIISLESPFPSFFNLHKIEIVLIFFILNC